MDIAKLRAATPDLNQENLPICYVSNAGHFAATCGRGYVAILAEMNTDEFCANMMASLGQKMQEGQHPDEHMQVTMPIGTSESVAIFRVRAATATAGQVMIDFVFTGTAA